MSQHNMSQHNTSQYSLNQSKLQSILQHPHIRRGREIKPAAGFTPTGRDDLNPLLPDGWPLGGLTEILVPQPGVGELSLLMPALARLSREQRWLAWIAPPHTPYAPALAAHGVDLSKVLLIHPKAVKDALWAVEQTLKSGTCSVVMAWLQQADFHSLRRLQLAAADGHSLCLLFRPHAAAAEASPAQLRLRLEAIPEGVRAWPLKHYGGRGPVGVRLGGASRGANSVAMA